MNNISSGEIGLIIMQLRQLSNRIYSLTEKGGRMSSLIREEILLPLHKIDHGLRDIEAELKYNEIKPREEIDD